MDLSKFQKRKLDPALELKVTGKNKIPPPAKAPAQEAQNPQTPQQQSLHNNPVIDNYLAGTTYQEGQLPLPPVSKAKVQRTPFEISKGDLLPEEVETLEALGITDEKLPADVAQILHEYKQQGAEPPVDEKTFKRPDPPKTVDISSLPAEKQEELRQQIQKSKQIYGLLAERHSEGRKLSDVDKARINQLGGKAVFDDLVEDDITGAEQQPKQVQPRPESEPRRAPTLEDLEEEVQASAGVSNNPFPRPAPYKEKEEKEQQEKQQQQQQQQSETGVDKAKLHYCPHCMWDLSQPDHEKPSLDDKLAFLHCMQGLLPFVKTYKFLGDRFEIKFRTLTVGEMQAAQSQAYVDLEKGRIPSNELDFWETVNRYRLYLQIQSIKTEKSHNTFPDGFTPRTNPGAQEYWDVDRTLLEEKDNELVVVQQYMMDEVLRTEMFYRVIFQMVQKFNRYVAALEARSYHPDFLSETA